MVVGDLDKVADKNGVNHDEVVLAYAQGAPPGSLQVNLAVLNYTSTQPINASQPLFVTQVLSPYPIDKPLDHQAHTQISELFSVAIGDFDGDGQNEIALATLGPGSSSQINLSIFRYVHKLLTDTPSLVLVSSQEFGFLANDSVPTISLVAGDFAGTHKKAELALALETYEPDDQAVFNDLYVIDVEPTAADPTKLIATVKGHTGELPGIGIAPNEPTRIKALAGLFYYDPEHGFDLYRREIAVVSASQNSLDVTFALLTIDNDDWDFQLSASTQNGNSSTSFTVTAGALSPSPSIDSPVWQIAIESFTGRGAREIDEYSPPPAYSFPQSQPVLTNDWLWPCALCNDMDDGSLRPPLQAYDYRGRTVLLGAPFRITFDNLINTDFVLQEPPKHAYWDEAQKKLVIVSRVPGINVSMTNKQGVTFSGMSTDTSAHSEGGSDAVSAGASAGGGFLGLFDVSASVETSEKSSYNYETNKSSYNSNYSSRSLSEAESTDNDDFISGRMQGMNIWRYRVLGVPGTVAGKTVNTFYDLLLPGTTVKFNGSGLDFDWYQPLHENGNILSYPSASSNDPSSPPAFSPPDLGTYEIPCPQPGAPDCKNGKVSVSGAMIPATAEFISGTSGSIGLDYSNNTGSGNTLSYQHTTGTSTDVKVGFSASGSIFGATVEANASYQHTLTVATAG